MFNKFRRLPEEMKSCIVLGSIIALVLVTVGSGLLVGLFSIYYANWN